MPWERMRSRREDELGAEGLSSPATPSAPSVPSLIRRSRAPLGPIGTDSAVRTRPSLLRPAARKAIRQRMLLLRSNSLGRIAELTGASDTELKEFRRDLAQSDLPDLLLNRGAGSAFVQELPHGALLYLLVRALRPKRAVETGIRPGYSTAWVLAAMEANGMGELTSLGPGTANGRAKGVHDVSVGQFVAPALRARWTLVLGNTPEQLDGILARGAGIDLYFYDNGPEADRARFELRRAWQSLTPHGLLLAHHADATPAWAEFCRAQGLAPQFLDPGPPPLGALAMGRT